MRDNILVTGGRGKTGSRLIKILSDKGISHNVAARVPEEENEIAFDWLNPEMAIKAFEGVTSAYIVAPTNTSEHGKIVIPILERAIDLGLRRIVLLSASAIEAGGPMMGQIHSWLINNAPEWTVLRPTWFMQNFSEQHHVKTINEESKIYSATGTGRVAFIDAQDIARVAADALLSTESWNRAVLLTGPHPLSYGDVAKKLSLALGRNVSHHNLSYSEFVRQLQKLGLDKNYSQILANMDINVANHLEEYVSEDTEQFTGQYPNSFDDFILREKPTWRLK
ncbi:NAD(P)H-binding protein [Pseudoalteromonas mariniglutinosa]|uniref:NAD(P)H-binding protein n=1 Tax=Pseudoalteromonas mariniglutinosa TaxID=206042 RepID=UPI003850AACA